MTRLTFGKDTGSYSAYAPMPSTNKWNASLTTSSATSITVPTTHATWIVSFRYFPNDVWVDTTGATAAVPVGATLAVCTSELNPASLTLPSGATISMITAQAAGADVSIVMWPASFP